MIPYASIAVAVVVGGLTITAYALYERGNAASARAEAAEERVATLKQTVIEQEADKEALRVAAEVLDATLVQRDRRNAELETRNRKAKEELNALRQTLPKEDQDCLDRALPDSLAKRLRDS